MGFDMHRPLTVAPRGVTPGLKPMILGLAVVAVQVGASPIGPALAGAPSLNPNGSGMIRMAQGDPAIPSRIRRLPAPQTDGTADGDPGVPTRTKEAVHPSSAPEKKSGQSTDKPE